VRGVPGTPNDDKGLTVDVEIKYPAQRAANTSCPRSDRFWLNQVNRQPAVDSTAASSRPKQVIPLSNFFDASQKLVWPGQASPEVGLKEKREIFERASLAVLEESRQHGVASIATVTAARQKLLDYGRPALQKVGASSTPQVADTFHHFLLSLYDSLAQSAAPPEITAGSAPKP